MIIYETLRKHTVVRLLSANKLTLPKYEVII